MKGKSLFILFLLTTAILSYVYFGIEKPAKEKEAAQAQEDRLVSEDLALVQDFKIETKTSKIHLERQNIGWKMTEPLEDLAAQSKVESLISAIEKFKKSRLLYSTPDLNAKKIDLAPYGLSSPSIVLEYKTSAMSAPKKIQLGTQNPSGSFTYVLTDQGLSLATMDLDYLSSQTPEDFREMRLTTISGPEIADLSLTAKSKTVKLQRDKGQWVMLSPWEHIPLDQDFVNSLAEKVTFIRANKFLPLTAASNLAQPDIRLIAGFKEGVKDMRSKESDVRPHGLEVVMAKVKKREEKSKPKNQKAQDPSENFDYFAKSDKTPPAAINPFNYDNFQKDPEDFIRKTFDQWLNSQVQKIEIEPQGASSIIIAQKDGVFVSETAGVKVNSSAVDKLLNQMRSLKATKVVGPLSEKNAPKRDLRVRIFLSDKDLVYDLRFDPNAIDLIYKEGKWTLHYLLSKDSLQKKSFEAASLAGVEASPLTSPTDAHTQGDKP